MSDPSRVAPVVPDPVLLVRDSPGRVLLKLRFDDDGRLVAEYDPADLDEAARVFLDAVIRIHETRRIP